MFRQGPAEIEISNELSNNQRYVDMNGTSNRGWLLEYP